MPLNIDFHKSFNDGNSIYGCIEKSTLDVGKMPGHETPKRRNAELSAEFPLVLHNFYVDTN